MKTNPENPEGWTLPAGLPTTFSIPQPFRESLAPKIQEWLNSVEKRIDGLTLKRIEEEAYKLYDEEGPDITEDSLDNDDLYRLGRRIFYARMQQIIDIIFPDRCIELGIDVLWGQTTNVLPGWAVTDALMDGEGINSVDLSGAVAAGELKA
jgi:hypothetical protein